jgi:cathepsin B
MLNFSYKDILDNSKSKSIYVKKKNFQFSSPTKYKLNTDIRFKYNKPKFSTPLTTDLPPSFDSSKNPLTTPVMNQGHCGSCFAVSTATAISDVFSIGLNLSFNPYLSPMYILSSIINDSDICDNGGNPYDVLEIIEKNGIATNICVSYKEACLESSCNSYMIPSKGCCNNKIDHYLYYVSNIRVETNIDLIKQHIFKYGCAIGGFSVYKDFYDNYDGTGIYIDKGTDKVPEGFHAICVIGWGNENGIDYWICRNSWGSSWGNNGYFKYAMYNKGVNERNALEKIYTTGDSQIGGIILFEPNGAKKSELPLSDCKFLNNLDEYIKTKLVSFYGTKENDPIDKTGKTINDPIYTDKDIDKDKILNYLKNPYVISAIIILIIILIILVL